ncbi:MAG: hypothetical protein EOP09_06730, partial [Proteobacteria bacterium]
LSHLVICRAGSSTLAELAAVGRPAFLIPFPFASDNHQEKNARLFERASAARVFLQDQSTSAQLADAIREMAQHAAAGVDMRQAVLTLHTAEGLDVIVRNLVA